MNGGLAGLRGREPAIGFPLASWHGDAEKRKQGDAENEEIVTKSDAPPFSRRAAVGLGLAAAAWVQVGTITRAEASPGEVPRGFPAAVDLHRAVFENWDKTISTDRLWTSTVRSPDEVAQIANWAAGAGYRLRPRGCGHNWSPLVAEDDTSASAKVVLIDTSQLDAMRMDSPERVRVQGGAQMEALLRYLARQGRSLIGAPAPGDVTVAGVLAVNGHGTNLPRRGETVPEGATYGTLSNTVVEITAVVWNPASRAYELRTFQRSEADAGALLVSLGRTVVTEVVLQTVPNYHLRCRNITSIHQEVLFAAPQEAGEQSLSALVDKHGRVGLIWFAMTSYPWIQAWDVEPKRPRGSRPVFGPYNYPFADNLPDAVASIIARMTRGSWSLTPTATATQFSVAAAGLTASGARDMWGEARCFLNFVKPTTLKVSAGSHVVLTSRAQVQRVVHEFTRHYLRLIEQFKGEGFYPANNTCEIRITGLDHPQDTGIPGAQQALLSAAAPVPGRPDLDTAVWLDVLNLPGSPRTDALFAGLERWFTTLPAEWGVARPEWAKRFATSAQGPWTDAATLSTWIPQQVPGFRRAAATFDRLDPHGIFRAPLHDRLMPKASPGR